MGSDEWYLSSPDPASGGFPAECARTATQMSLTTALFKCEGEAAAVSTNFVLKTFEYGID